MQQFRIRHITEHHPRYGRVQVMIPDNGRPATYTTYSTGIRRIEQRRGDWVRIYRADPTTRDGWRPLGRVCALRTGDWIVYDDQQYVIARCGDYTAAETTLIGRRDD